MGRIIRATLTEPKYILLHVQASLKATWAQLGLFAIGDGWGPFTAGTGVHDTLQTYFPKDMNTLDRSHQHEGSMHWIPVFIRIHRYALLASILLLVPLLFLGLHRLPTHLLPVALIILLAVILNAWTSGTFSGEVDRFGSKMIWLVPLLVIQSTITVWPAGQGSSVTDK